MELLKLIKLIALRGVLHMRTCMRAEQGHGNESAPSFDYLAQGNAPGIMAKFKIYPKPHRYHRRSCKAKGVKPSFLSKMIVFMRDYRILQFLAVATFLYLQYCACTDYGKRIMPLIERTAPPISYIVTCTGFGSP